MNAATFTDQDFDTLLALLLPFDESYPNLSPYFDRFFYHLSARLEGEYQFSFGVFRQKANEARAMRANKDNQRTAFELGLIALILTGYLQKAAIRFPDIDQHADRVMYEIIRVIVEMEGKAKFESLKMTARTFDEFHLDHRMRRQVFNSKVKGVG